MRTDFGSLAAQSSVRSIYEAPLAFVLSTALFRELRRAGFSTASMSSVTSVVCPPFPLLVSPACQPDSNWEGEIWKGR